jgi:hypothetical protein
MAGISLNLNFCELSDAGTGIGYIYRIMVAPLTNGKMFMKKLAIWAIVSGSERSFIYRKWAKCKSDAARNM